MFAEQVEELEQLVRDLLAELGCSVVLLARNYDAMEALKQTFQVVVTKF